MGDDEQIFTDQMDGFVQFFQLPDSDALRAQANDLSLKADMMDIDSLLPELEQNVMDWYQKPEGRAYPSGEAVGRLQSLLQLDADGVMGYDTVNGMLEKLQEGILASGRYDTAPDITELPALSQFSQSVAGDTFTGYVGALDERYVNIMQMVEMENQMQLISYVNEQYASCNMEEFAFDPELYVKNFIDRVKEGAEPHEALAQECNNWVAPLDPVQREAIQRDFFDINNPVLAEQYLAMQDKEIKASADAAVVPDADVSSQPVLTKNAGIKM